MTGPSLKPSPSPTDAPLPERFHRTLAQWGIEVNGQRIAVLGTRLGRLSDALARRGARVVDVRPAGDQLPALARYPEIHAGRSALPFASSSLDGIACRDDLHPSEALRVLRPGGWLVQAWFEWLPLPDEPTRSSEACLSTHGLPASAERSHGLQVSWLRDLRLAGFEGLVSASSDHPVPFERQGWTQAVLAEAKRRGLPAGARTERLTTDLEPALAQPFVVEPLDVPHRLFVLAGWRSRRA